MCLVDRGLRGWLGWGKTGNASLLSAASVSSAVKFPAISQPPIPAPDHDLALRVPQGLELVETAHDPV
jgi:hypothetical protein